VVKDDLNVAQPNFPFFVKIGVN